MPGLGWLACPEHEVSVANYILYQKLCRLRKTLKLASVLVSVSFNVHQMGSVQRNSRALSIIQYFKVGTLKS